MTNPWTKHSFETAIKYMDDVQLAIDALNVRPTQDADMQRIEINIANLSKALLQQIADYQRRQYECFKEDAGPPEDLKLSMQQLGVNPR